MWAVMDIGTNSCRLLLAEMRNNKVEVVARFLRTTRLGQGLGEMGMLQREAMERTVEALKEFTLLQKEYPLTKRYLVATNAVREAANGHELVELVKKELGWQVDVISGKREAWLSYLGATWDLEESLKPIVVDIGGGSTELMQLEMTGSLLGVSLPLGALRLWESPLTEGEIQKIFRKRAPFIIDSSTPLIGVGGTCTTLGAVKLGLTEYDAERVQGLKVTFQELKEIHRDLSALTPEGRLLVPGIYAGRQDIIVPGLQILAGLMTVGGFLDVQISDRDLLFGLIYEQLP